MSSPESGTSATTGAWPSMATGTEPKALMHSKDSCSGAPGRTKGSASVRARSHEPSSQATSSTSFSSSSRRSQRLAELQRRTGHRLVQEIALRLRDVREAILDEAVPMEREYHRRIRVRHGRHGDRHEGQAVGNELRFDLVEQVHLD